MITRIRRYLCCHDYDRSILKCLNVFNMKPFEMNILACGKCGKFIPDGDMIMKMKFEAENANENI